MAVAVEVGPAQRTGRGASASPAPATRAPGGPYARARGRGEALDHAARLEAAFRRHYPTLVQICRERTSDPSRAEDLAQETLVRALRYGHGFDPSRPILPWLRTIATRVVIDDAARAANRRECPTELHADRELVADDVVDEEALARLVGDADLRAAFGALTPPQQVAMRLRFLEDWSGGDTARFLGINRAACDQVVARAKRRLREQLERLDEAYPAILPVPVARLVARVRAWFVQRRAAAHACELGVPSTGALADAVAMAVAVAVAVAAGSSAAGVATAWADAAGSATRVVVGAVAPAGAALEHAEHDAAPAVPAGGRHEAARTATTSATAPGSSSHYRLDTPSEPALDPAPPTRAELAMAEDPQVARVDATVTVSTLGYEVRAVDLHVTVPCDGPEVSARTTCSTVGWANERLPGNGGPSDGSDAGGAPPVPAGP